MDLHFLTRECLGWRRDLRQMTGSKHSQEGTSGPHTRKGSSSPKVAPPILVSVPSSETNYGFRRLVNTLPTVSKFGMRSARRMVRTPTHSATALGFVSDSALGRGMPVRRIFYRSIGMA